MQQVLLAFTRTLCTWLSCGISFLSARNPDRMQGSDLGRYRIYSNMIIPPCPPSNDLIFLTRWLVYTYILIPNSPCSVSLTPSLVSSLSVISIYAQTPAMQLPALISNNQKDGKKTLYAHPPPIPLKIYLPSEIGSHPPPSP